MMVTVAKSLDVPIKLMFPRPPTGSEPPTASAHAMLGLGDVVLPGIMIGLALRFDLYLFYLRRQVRTPATKEGEPDTIVKPQYHSLAGRWSDHFWTHSFTGRPLWTSPQSNESKPEAPFTFPKTYFKASITGYILGLMATLGVMVVWNHAQPALLYLVPGVLGSIWLTALFRGELGLMWNFSEEIDEEEGAQSKDGEKKDKLDKQDNNEDEAKAKRTKSKRPEREVLAFSIEAPWQMKSSAKKGEKEDSEAKKSPEGKSKSKGKAEKHNWAPVKSEIPAVEEGHAGKRVRLN